MTQLYLQLYITYQLHVSAISDLAVIKLDIIIRETIEHHLIRHNQQCQCKFRETRSRLQKVWGERAGLRENLTVENA